MKMHASIHLPVKIGPSLSRESLSNFVRGGSPITLAMMVGHESCPSGLWIVFFHRHSESIEYAVLHTLQAKFSGLQDFFKISLCLCCVQASSFLFVGMWRVCKFSKIQGALSSRPKGDPGPLPIFQDFFTLVKSHPWSLCMSLFM